MSIFPVAVNPMFAASSRMQPGIGAEEEMVQRAALVQIKTLLPEMVAFQEQLWKPRDEEFAALMGWTYKPIQIEIPEARNFYAGGRPSLVEAPVSFWPSITVRANTAQPAGDQIDEVDVSDVPLFVEIFCKSGPVAQNKLHDADGIKADGLVDAQSQRLTSAVMGCVATDKTLGGVVALIARPPIVKSSIPFARPGAGKQGTGDYYVFQGKSLQYVTTKYSY